MQMNLPLFFDDLDAQIMSNLVDASRQAEDFEPIELLEKVHSHLELARSKAATHPMIHLRLAEALTQTYSVVVERWAEIPGAAQNWLKGAMLYFVNLNDSDHDFDSPIGFEDDVEVLNACLLFAGLEALCLNPEEFD